MKKGDNANSMSVTGQNKTLLGEVTVTVDGEKDTADIEAPENVTSELASAVIHMHRNMDSNQFK